MYGNGLDPFCEFQTLNFLSSSVCSEKTCLAPITFSVKTAEFVFGLWGKLTCYAMPELLVDIIGCGYEPTGSTVDWVEARIHASKSNHSMEGYN